jgi:DNA-binding MarR family transcriptional regulator
MQDNSGMSTAKRSPAPARRIPAPESAPPAAAARAARRPAVAPAPAPARFYRGDAGWDTDASIGHMVRLVIGTMNRAIDARMQQDELTAMQWKPLLMLRLGRADTAAGLARLNCSDNGAMTRMLDRLEAKGLLRRVRSATDRRVVHLALTPEGEQVADRIPAALSDVLNAHLAGFSRAEFGQLQDFFRRLIANGERLAPAGSASADGEQA